MWLCCAIHCGRPSWGIRKLCQRYLQTTASFVAIPGRPGYIIAKMNKKNNTGAFWYLWLTLLAVGAVFPRHWQQYYQSLKSEATIMYENYKEKHQWTNKCIHMYVYMYVCVFKHIYIILIFMQLYIKYVITNTHLHI